MASTKFDDNSGTSGIPAPGTFGVWGDSLHGYGVVGTSSEGSRAGVYGESNGGDSGGLTAMSAGVEGVHNNKGGCGVKGRSRNNIGVVGEGNRGVFGLGVDIGIEGLSNNVGIFLNEEPGTTTTVVHSKANPTNVGDSTTFTALVTRAGGGTPSAGTVTASTTAAAHTSAWCRRAHFAARCGMLGRRAWIG